MITHTQLEGQQDLQKVSIEIIPGANHITGASRPDLTNDELASLDQKVKLLGIKTTCLAYNTDNKGKLFVTLFAFAPEYQDNFVMVLHPDTRIRTQLTGSCTVTNFWLRDNLYRDTRKAH